MATFKYFLAKQGKDSTIYIRFANGRKFDLKKATPYSVNSEHWNAEKEEIRNISTVKDRGDINEKLVDLKTFVKKTFRDEYANGIRINSQWLEFTIDRFHKQNTDANFNEFTVFGRYYIDEKLPYKKNKSKNAQIGVDKRTIEKYDNVLSKIEAFQKHKKKVVLFSEMDSSFETDFIKYLKEIDKLSTNTIGRLLTFVRTFVKEARKKGIVTHPEVDEIKGFKEKIEFIYLNDFELDRIYNFDFSNKSYLANARDWLIIGAYSGQRVSDFMLFNKGIIKDGYLEFTQVKTGAKTLVPIHHYIKNILNENGGDFPRKISEQRFNDYIKEVCKEVGINEIVHGGKINPETKRKEYGKFPKYELVTSHICRRSFATNHYAKLPTPVIMNITNHSTERMFLNYIGKTPKDYAEILKDYWEELKKGNENSHLRVSKNLA